MYMYALVMDRRNNDMWSIQKINTCIAFIFHAGKHRLDIFNKAKKTLFCREWIYIFGHNGKFKHQRLVQRVQLETGGEVTVENVNGMTVERDVRLNGGNKHHYTTSTYYPDRETLMDLQKSWSTTPTPQEEINVDAFYMYLSAEEA